MANLKEIRNRITSISSTMQITSAMKMVSAAKLKKAQDAITAMRPYAEKLTGGQRITDCDQESVNLFFSTNFGENNSYMKQYASDHNVREWKENDIKSWKNVGKMQKYLTEALRFFMI